MSKDEDDAAAKEIERQIKEAGNKVEPEDKNALANIRERTKAAEEGNGKSGKGK